MEHLKHVKENSFLYTEWENNDFNFECLIFDTESCQFKEGDNAGAKVYGWGLGCTRSDKMIYGQTMKQFFDTMQNLFTQYFNTTIKNIPLKAKNKKYPEIKYYKIPCGVHNLGWDIEFFKYSLANLGFNYQIGELKETKSKGVFYTTCADIEKEKTFHIVQADNVVYGTTIYFPSKHTIINKDGSHTKIALCLDVFDTYKIISCAESQFPKYVHGVDEMFYKMSEQYDYETYREEGHIQTDLELRYQYNDIYLLKETVQQFYIDGLCEGHMPELGRRTASSIAFHKLKKMTFGDKKTEDLYNAYFEIDRTTQFEITRKRIEKASYKGGFTHASHLYVNKDIKKEGCSLDINSSYPSQMAYKKFPYGKPKKGKKGVLPNINDKQVYLVEVGFDYVKPKTDKDKLAIFKIGASNIKSLKEIVGGVSGQEYFMTNITEDNRILDVVSMVEGCKLQTSYNVVLTNVELEFWNKHFDFGCYELDEFGCVVEGQEMNFNGLAIGEVLIYKAEVGKFREYVEYFTEMKVNNKKIGNIPLTNQAKLFLNSAYGKFGTRTEKVEKDLILDKNGLYTFVGEGSLQYESKEFYRPYASFVTAYGRLQLWNAIINAVGVENFIYCDTDSIYCFRDEESLTRDMNKIGEYIDPTTLGKWDIESHFNRFKVLGQKKYMYHDYVENKTKLKCCGLPKSAQSMIINQGFNEFYLGKEVEGKKQKKKVIGGCLLLDAKFKIKKVMW